MLLFLLAFVTIPPVSYNIDARFLPAPATVSGTATITFRNISTVPQKSLYLYLYPNAFKHHKTQLVTELMQQGSLEWARRRGKKFGSLEIEKVCYNNAPLDFKIDATVLEILLPYALAPEESITFTMSFTTHIPNLILNFGKKGSVFILTRWYPQVAAFDRFGWHLGDFHPHGAPAGAFADYEVRLNTPKKYVIATNGELSNNSDTLRYFRATNLTDFALFIAPDLVFYHDSKTAPTVDIFLTRNLSNLVHQIVHQVRLINTIFTDLFGPPPYDRLTIVVAPGIAPAPISAPGLIVIGQQPLPFIRLWEKTVAQEIGKQFFAFNPAPDGVRNPLLVNGISAYAAHRYLKTVYGENNLLDLPFSLPFLNGLSDTYLDRLYFYLAATNNLTSSLTQPNPKPLATEAMVTSQAVLLFKSLEKELGTAQLDSALRRYIKTNRNLHSTTPAFLATVTQVAGPEKEVIVNWLLSQDGKTDLAIRRVRHINNHTEITISAQNAANLPIELKTVFADNRCRIDTISPQNSCLLLPRGQKFVYLNLDPEEKVLDANRWNNRFPRQLKIKPIFALPDFETYQIFYGPWFWFDTYRGFQPGIWLAGRKLFDAGPLKGAHNWVILQNYASLKSDWHTGVSYQTPIIFNPFKSRIYFSGDNSFRDRGIRLYLLNDFGPPLAPPKTEFDFGYRVYELLDSTGRDPRAWQLARIAELRFRLAHNRQSPFSNLNGELLLNQGQKKLLSQFEYSKFSLTENLTVFIPEIIPVSIRLFAGTIFGTTPPQEEFYLSGGLSYTPAEPVSWAYEGFASGQEHWHYDGDVNCRGYYGQYRHGRFAYGLNIHLLFPAPDFPFPLSVLQPFFDLGNVGDSLNRKLFSPCLDAGIRVKLGPLYADFPFWKSKPEPGESHFAFRWSLGFKISDLPSGF